MRERERARHSAFTYALARVDSIHRWLFPEVLLGHKQDLTDSVARNRKLHALLEDSAVRVQFSKVRRYSPILPANFPRPLIFGGGRSLNARQQKTEQNHEELISPISLSPSPPHSPRTPAADYIVRCCGGISIISTTRHQKIPF